MTVKKVRQRITMSMKIYKLCPSLKTDNFMNNYLFMRHKREGQQQANKQLEFRTKTNLGEKT